MNTATKNAAQLSLEAIISKNKTQADAMQRAALDKLEENERIKAEMHKILSEPPPVSTLVAAFRDATMPPTDGPVSVKLAAEKEVIYAALAIVRSWRRRNKKNWQAQEKELMSAVERLTWKE